ncbi:DUF4931 domain-containing protein [Peribacillus sp. SCS-26]|uniref:DUF4931 domain-containing protein n=1 Tax=Paraperibacillus marinus TaxID=3115295 RepID=UPI00390613C2
MHSANELLHFQNHIGAGKPNSMRDRTAACPFCDRKSLTGILDECGPILHIKNKYPTLLDTTQTLIIETDDCEGNLSNYNEDHLYSLIDFTLRKWEEMMAGGEHESVILYKNHGPLSGGTIHHSHMQIVGLKKADYMNKIVPEYFAGPYAAKGEDVDFTISDHPIMGFTELNVILKDRVAVKKFSKYIQIAAHFILNHFHRGCSSFNLFFYKLDGNIICKAVPRFVDSPLFIGYSLSQVSNNLEDTAKRLQSLYSF